MDKLSLDRIQSSHPLIIQPALDAFAEIDCALKGRAICRIHEAGRSFEKQAEYYALGRTKVNPDGRSASMPLGNIITNATPGSSIHQYDLAFDIVLMVDTDGNGTYETARWDSKTDYDGDMVADWFECLAAFKKHGFTIGAEFRTFPDLPHVQMTFGYSWQELLALYNKKDFITGTSFVNIIPRAVLYEVITNLNLRTAPGGSIIKTLPKGTKIEVLKRDGTWGNVKLLDGSSGWLSTDYITKAA